MKVNEIKIDFTAYYGRVGVDIKLGKTDKYKMDLKDLKDYIENKIKVGEVKYIDGKGNLKPRIVLV